MTGNMRREHRFVYPCLLLKCSFKENPFELIVIQSVSTSMPLMLTEWKCLQCKVKLPDCFYFTRCTVSGVLHQSVTILKPGESLLVFSVSPQLWLSPSPEHRVEAARRKAHCYELDINVMHFVAVDETWQHWWTDSIILQAYNSGTSFRLTPQLNPCISSHLIAHAFPDFLIWIHWHWCLHWWGALRADHL